MIGIFANFAHAQGIICKWVDLKCDSVIRVFRDGKSDQVISELESISLRLDSLSEQIAIFRNVSEKMSMEVNDFDDSVQAASHEYDSLAAITARSNKIHNHLSISYQRLRMVRDRQMRASLKLDANERLVVSIIDEYQKDRYESRILLRKIVDAKTLENACPRASIVAGTVEIYSMRHYSNRFGIPEPGGW